MLLIVEVMEVVVVSEVAVDSVEVEVVTTDSVMSTTVREAAPGEEEVDTGEEEVDMVEDMTSLEPLLTVAGDPALPHTCPSTNLDTNKWSGGERPLVIKVYER